MKIKLNQNRMKTESEHKIGWDFFNKFTSNFSNYSRQFSFLLSVSNDVSLFFLTLVEKEIDNKNETK
jgi:hypothetical protein